MEIEEGDVIEIPDLPDSLYIVGRIETNQSGYFSTIRLDQKFKKSIFMTHRRNH